MWLINKMLHEILHIDFLDTVTMPLRRVVNIGGFLRFGHMEHLSYTSANIVGTCGTAEPWDSHGLFLFPSVMAYIISTYHSSSILSSCSSGKQFSPECMPKCPNICLCYMVGELVELRKVVVATEGEQLRRSITSHATLSVLFLAPLVSYAIWYFIWEDFNSSCFDIFTNQLISTKSSLNSGKQFAPQFKAGHWTWPLLAEKVASKKPKCYSIMYRHALCLPPNHVYNTQLQRCVLLSEAECARASVNGPGASRVLVERGPRVASSLLIRSCINLGQYQALCFRTITSTPGVCDWSIDAAESCREPVASPLTRTMGPRTLEPRGNRSRWRMEAFFFSFEWWSEFWISGVWFINCSNCVTRIVRHWSSYPGLLVELVAKSSGLGGAGCADNFSLAFLRKPWLSN